MNLYQAALLLAQAERTSDVTGHPVKNIRGLKADHRKPLNAGKKAAFLRAFGNNFSITESARLVGIDRTTHNEWFAQDAKYQAAFEKKLLVAVDLLRDDLVRRARIGDFKPVIYNGRICYAPRIRTICQLADGTSAFQDELPKGAEVTGTRMVTTYDGEMIGTYKRDDRALLKLLALNMPEEFGHVSRRKRANPPVDTTPFPTVSREELLRRLARLRE